MDQLAIAIWGLAITIAVAFVGWFFKTPKETANEMTRRFDELEEAHHALDKDYTGFRERIVGELHNLTDAINRLSAVIGQTGITSSGEHRIVRR